MGKDHKYLSSIEFDYIERVGDCGLDTFTTDIIKSVDGLIGYEKSEYWIRINDIKAHSREGFSRMMVELAKIAKREGYSELHYDGSDETSIYYLESFGFREVWRDNNNNISLRANI